MPDHEANRLPGTFHNPAPFEGLDATPFARALAVSLGLVDADFETTLRELTYDEDEGSIHLVHLVVVCERVGGVLHRGGHVRGDYEVGPGPAALVEALQQDGIEAAITVARAYTADDRYYAFDGLLHYWQAPINALHIEFDDALLEDQRRRNWP